ncbi:MAG: hypothetical protein ACYCS2_03335 [Acidimicrobiales bacterium]
MTMTNGSDCGHSAGMHGPCPICRTSEIDRKVRRDHSGPTARDLLADWEHRADVLLAELSNDLAGSHKG